MPPRRKSKLVEDGDYGDIPPVDKTTTEQGEAERPKAEVDVPEVPSGEGTPELPAAGSAQDESEGEPEATGEPDGRRRRGGRRPSAPVTRNPRRLRVSGKVADEDMVSFNCKMSRGLRRSVRHYAADSEVDIQDVVAAALAEYLTRRNRPVPAFELRQPD